VIDIKVVRADPDRARASQRKRGADESAIATLLNADDDRKAASRLLDDLRAQQKVASRTVRAADETSRNDQIRSARALAERIKAAESHLSEVLNRLAQIQRDIANVVEDEVPSGGENDFHIIRHVDTPAEYDFTPHDHVELAEKLHAIDLKRGAKVSGARFYFLTGIGAQLQLALLQMAMQQAIGLGFTPLITPALVRPEIMEGTGFLGQHSDEVYYLQNDDLYLVGTSEVPIAGYHKDEILDLSGGPLRYAGWSSCFRREAGSYGKDTKGILRVHQFDKIEMFSFSMPNEATDEHLRLLSWQEDMLSKIEVPYRVIDVAAGDLGSSAARKFDCEAWIPSQGRYRELTSSSNCGTYQSQSLNIRFHSTHGLTNVATLNGTLATTRWLVAILETHQQKDGSVRVPTALQPFMNGRDVLQPE